MKIVLTHTYFLEEDENEKRIMKPYPPLGILYLSSFLRKNNINVKVYDTTFTSFSDLIKYLNQESPDIIGIYCNLLTKYNVLKLVNYCQTNKIISILGGPDASTQREEFLQFGADIIISGEGEESLLEVIKALRLRSSQELYEIPNVSFKSADGTIVINKNLASRCHLDDYPFPDRSVIDMDEYLNVWETYHGQRPISLVTARGCAFSCKWCSHSVYGYKHRRRKPANVIQELKDLIAAYNPTHLWFADDVFTVNKYWLRKFQNLLQEEHICLPYECIGRVDRLDEEIVTLLSKSGCYRIWFGAESGSQKILDAMSRGISLSQITKSRQLCERHGIEFGIFVMFGYPGEELEDIYETISFVRDLQPDKYLTTVAYPLRGTKLYDEIQDQIIYPSEWKDHLQRDLEIKNRFHRSLYSYAIKKTGSEYRKKQLDITGGNKLKKAYHVLRSKYCTYRIKQLAQIRTG
jgi:anaerobic magnesium-protoporphyrin IX monomethyl ester cyclase